jgi:hypothetical membrane protein
MRFSNQKVAGSLFLVGISQFILFLQVAQDLYPGYSVSQNRVSDLGATCTVTCVVHQPTATIFDSSIVLLGALVIVSSYFIQKSFGVRILTTFVFLTGMGALGVGIFPENTGVLHIIVSGVTFIFGGLGAIATYRVVRSPLNYISVILGFMILAFIGLYETSTYLGLGPGGMERMITYPEMIWGLAFSGFLLNSAVRVLSKKSEQKRR